MSIKATAGEVEITWTNGTLESAAAMSGTWAPVPSATASPDKAKPDAAMRFYPVKP